MTQWGFFFETILLVGAFVCAWLLTGFLRRIAVTRGLIDHPNARSSHTLPTPRGGGLGFVIAVSVCIAILWMQNVVETDFALAILVGGLLVAVVGILDDRSSLPVRLRLPAQFGAAAFAVVVMGGLPELRIGDRIVELGIAGHVLGTLGIVWTLNLFNFMDGIDGIAASEAVFITVSGALLLWIAGDAEAIVLVSVAVAAASLGFLVWNWPPAKIFMGDVGSGFLGFVIAVLALASARLSPVAIFVWLILGGVFFVDATVTLIRRLVARQRVYEAHRSHAYQCLSRRWSNHRRVTLSILVVNLGWLLPMAWLCQRYPYYAVVIVAVALVPIVVLALLAGAGRPEA